MQTETRKENDVMKFIELTLTEDYLPRAKTVHVRDDSIIKLVRCKHKDGDFTEVSFHSGSSCSLAVTESVDEVKALMDAA
jgi:hypothetical protein